MSAKTRTAVAFLVVATVALLGTILVGSASAKQLASSNDRFKQQLPSMQETAATR